MDWKHWKTFIKQSENVLQKVDEKFKGQLNFHGEEAKIAYDKIIQETTNEKTNSKLVVLKKELIRDNKVRKKSTTVKNKNVNININIILTAVEQNDLIFLQNNLSKSHVNIVDNFGWTPLMSAAYSGNIEIIKFLLKLGANKSLQDKSGHTALDFAIKKNHPDIVTMLKESNFKNKITNLIEDDENEKIKEFYCDICKNNFKETSIKKHETSTLHIFNTKPELPDPMYGISKDNRGYQIMLNNGWEEKQGLGPSGSGLKYPVKTVLKRDRKGFGKDSTKNARVTHFQSCDPSSIAHVKQFNIKKVFKRKDRDKYLTREAKRERALRRALS